MEIPTLILILLILLILSSNVYKFKAVHKDYEDEYFSLRLDWYQDELFINAGMKKKK